MLECKKDLPKEFKINIINIYKNRGMVKWYWYFNKKIYSKIKLENIRVADELSINLILYAKSQQYGNIILKIAPAGRTLISEVSALKHYSSDYSVKCYCYDKEEEIMILELLNPGTNLFDLDNQEERIKTFSMIANNNMFNPENENDFKTFEKKI